MIKPFRLKHKATGLYYIPSRFIWIEEDACRGYVKSNLSENGKCYLKRDPRKHITDIYAGYTNRNGRPIAILIQTTPDDFEIEHL